MGLENKEVDGLSLGLKGIDHPAIAANEGGRLADWYCDILGYQKYFRHDKGVWMLRAPDHTLLEIMPVDNSSRPDRTTWTPGWSHLALRVYNIEKAISFLNTKHIIWGGELTNAIGGGQVRNFFDPEGNMLQLVERTW